MKETSELPFGRGIVFWSAAVVASLRNVDVEAPFILLMPRWTACRGEYHLFNMGKLEDVVANARHPRRMRRAKTKGLPARLRNATKGSVHSKPPKLTTAPKKKSESHNPLQHEHLVLRDENPLIPTIIMPRLTLTHLQRLHQVSNFSTFPLPIRIRPKYPLNTHGVHSGHTTITWSRGTDLGLAENLVGGDGRWTWCSR